MIHTTNPPQVQVRPVTVETKTVQQQRWHQPSPQMCTAFRVTNFGSFTLVTPHQVECAPPGVRDERIDLVPHS